MLVVAASIIVLALAGQPPPTSVPDAPAAGLGLEPGPAIEPRVSAVPPPSAPAVGGQALPAGLAALVAGMGVLAARARRIGRAEREIRDALQDSLLSDVGRRELFHIAGQLAGLPASEANAAVAGLSDNELGVWMREIDGWRGGLLAAEQAALFRLLVNKLRPAQLARVAAAGRLRVIAEAAVTGTPADGRFELAGRLWAQHSPADDGWHAIAALVDSVPPATLAVRLSGTDITALSAALFAPYQRHPDAAPALDLDAAARFLSAVTGTADPGLKATVFHTFTGQMMATADQRVAGPVKRPELLGALAGLLRSDPAGTMSVLNHRVDPHANVTSLWVQHMIRHDRLDELDVLLADLAGVPDRLGHFTDPGTDEADPYPNASNLGYYVGAYGRAIDGLADRAEDRIDLVTKLFALFTGIVPVPGGGAVGLPLSPLVDRHAASVTKDLRDGAAGVKQTLWGLAKPRTPDGALWNGEGTSQFQDAWQEVMEIR